MSGLDTESGSEDECQTRLAEKPVVAGEISGFDTESDSEDEFQTHPAKKARTGEFGINETDMDQIARLTKDLCLKDDMIILLQKQLECMKEQMASTVYRPRCLICQFDGVGVYQCGTSGDFAACQGCFEGMLNFQDSTNESGVKTDRMDLWCPVCQYAGFVKIMVDQ